MRQKRKDIENGRGTIFRLVPQIKKKEKKRKKQRDGTNTTTLRPETNAIVMKTMAKPLRQTFSTQACFDDAKTDAASAVSSIVRYVSQVLRINFLFSSRHFRSRGVSFDCLSRPRDNSTIILTRLNLLRECDLNAIRYT